MRIMKLILKALKVELKDLFSGKRWIYFTVILVLGAFMVYYPYAIKNLIASEYRKALEKAIIDLEGKEREEAEELLTHVQKGELFSEEEHDTSDFMHQEYFNEPWRDWRNTYVVWQKARNYYFTFIFLLFLSVVYRRYRNLKLRESGG